MRLWTTQDAQLAHQVDRRLFSLAVRSGRTANRPRSARTVLILLAVCMALQMTGYVLILPLFARRFGDFGAGVEALGLSALAYALASTLSAPFMGSLADRFGRRPLLLGSLAVYVIAFSGYFLAASAPTFILLRALAGAFTAGLVPAVMGIVADLAPADRRAQWIGIVNGGASVGWIAGPVLGGLLYDRWGYTVPFAAAVAMAVVTLAVALFSIPETRPAAGAEEIQPARPQLRPDNLPALPGTLRDSLPPAVPTFLVLLGISFTVMFAWAFIEPQLMFYAYDDLGWTSSQLGLTMSTFGVACMLGEFALGRLSDRWGRKPVLVLGLVLFSAQFSGLVLFREVGLIVPAFILGGLGNALLDPALGAHILDIAPAGHKARIMGIKGTAGSLGGVLGPALVVLLAPAVRPQGVFLIATLLVVLVTLAAALGLKAPAGRRTFANQSE